MRIAAGEALAVIFEIDEFREVYGDTSGDTNKDGNNPLEGYIHLQGLRAKVLSQVRELAAEAAGKGSAKKDLKSQKSLYRDILDFLEDGYSPKTTANIGGESLNTSSWSQLIQLKFLKHFLKGGFVKHMQENEFLHDIFGFTPKKTIHLSDEELASNKQNEKRAYKSPNSVLSKARTKYLNKQRALTQDRREGHFAVGYEADD
ncbi:hypothetical protein Ancab_028860 [Ancistrocladus abbreviatus]